MPACWINAFPILTFWLKSSRFMCWKSKYVNFSSLSIQDCKRIDLHFNDKIHTEPPLRHLNPKLEFQLENFHFRFLHLPHLAGILLSDWHPVSVCVPFSGINVDFPDNHIMEVKAVYFQHGIVAKKPLERHADQCKTLLLRKEHEWI